MGPDELGEYCRAIEDHLTRVNGGHLVRIVGAGFELVRGWGETGIPLSIVCRGIDLKADRHRLGQAKRPLRIEFCEADVRELFEHWRRAVGLPRGDDSAGETPEEAPQKRPSLSRHLDRVIERLSRVLGRLELPEAFRADVSAVLEEASALRDAAKGSRGAARAELTARLGPLDERLIGAARIAAPAELTASLNQEAAAELAPYRDRLAAAAWQKAVDATVDRLLRDRYGLPRVGTEVFSTDSARGGTEVGS